MTVCPVLVCSMPSLLCVLDSVVVQGIWPKEADGTDINAVDRSHSQKLLATADDFGRVSVFNYPVTEKVCANRISQYRYADDCLCWQGLPTVQGRGHSSHVTNVRFNSDDSYLLTTGGNDKSLFQWRVTPIK